MTTQSPAPAHTPTPWTVSTAVKTFESNQTDGLFIDTPLGVTVCDLYFDAGPRLHKFESDEANAALIVRAVNSHAALVEALVAYDKAVNPPDKGGINLDEWDKRLKAATAQARAALALARPPVDVDVAQIAALTDAKGENQ